MSDAVIIPFPADEQPDPPRPVPVNNLVRNRRFDKARTCLYGLWVNAWLPGDRYDYLRKRVSRVHHRYSGWRAAAREGLAVVADLHDRLDPNEVVEIVEGLEEDWPHDETWLRKLLDELPDLAATLARLADGDPSAERRAEVDDVRAHLDECLRDLLNPAGVP